MINLDEAIKHCEKKAEECERDSHFDTDYVCYQMSEAERKELRECAKEHRQLVELLRELKSYRIAHYKLRDMDYEYDFNSKFGDNPMYYGEKVWELFGDIDEHQDEIMGYEEVNTDDN